MRLDVFDRPSDEGMTERGFRPGNEWSPHGPRDGGVLNPRKGARYVHRAIRPEVMGRIPAPRAARILGRRSWTRRGRGLECLRSIRRGEAGHEELLVLTKQGRRGAKSGERRTTAAIPLLRVERRVEAPVALHHGDEVRHIGYSRILKQYPIGKKWAASHSILPYW